MSSRNPATVAGKDPRSPLMCAKLAEKKHAMVKDEPCKRSSTHIVVFPDQRVIVLCDEHFYALCEAVRGEAEHRSPQAFTWAYLTWCDAGDGTALAQAELVKRAT